MVGVPRTALERGDDELAKELATKQGFFSVLRWRSDITRDEARNVAVLLIEPEGRFGGMRAAPLSSVSQSLREQGLLDQVLVDIAAQFSEAAKPDLGTLQDWHGRLQRSLYLSDPQPVAVSGEDETLDALYKAYLAPAGGPRRALTKGAVLDRVVAAYRKQGHEVQRAHYIEDFIFDVVLNGPSTKPTVVEVLSFAAPRKDWTPVEKDAGHFLFAVASLGVAGRAVIQGPGEDSDRSATEPYDRVRRWLDRADVPIQAPEDLVAQQLALESQESN